MKIAVVTGVSMGIGKAVAKALLDGGWKVYGVSRTAPIIENERFVWLKCDLAQASDISTNLAIEEANIDLLVSNAGVAFLEAAVDVSVESYRKMYDVNVLAPMLLVAALKNKIQKSTIITVSSVSDRIMDVDFALYCSSKAANTRYFETLAMELKDAKVISLLPDYIDTPMLRKLQEGTDFDWSQTITVDEMAQLVTGLTEGTIDLESGSNVIVINDQMLEDLESREKLYGYNTTNNTLIKL